VSPYKPKKPCKYSNCKELTNERYCIQHKKQIDKQYNKERGSSTQQGYGVNHRKLRLLYLSEHPICEDCNEEPSNELHHIDGDNQNLDEENLEALCKRCHSKLRWNDEVSKM